MNHSNKFVAHLKFCIQTIPKTPWNSEVRCIARNCLVLLKTYVPWPTYTSLGQFLACSQKNHRGMPLFHEKCHDNVLEFSCGDSFKMIILKLLMFLGLHRWNVFLVECFYNPSLVRDWRWVAQRFKGINTRWCVG